MCWNLKRKCYFPASHFDPLKGIFKGKNEIKSDFKDTLDLDFGHKWYVDNEKKKKKNPCSQQTGCMLF